MNTASFEFSCVLSDQCRYLFIAKFKCIPPAIVCNSQQGTKKKVSTHDHAVSHDNQTHCTMCIIISWISISASFEWILVNLIEWWQSCGILKILIFFFFISSPSMIGHWVEWIFGETHSITSTKCSWNTLDEREAESLHRGLKKFLFTAKNRENKNKNTELPLRQAQCSHMTFRFPPSHDALLFKPTADALSFFVWSRLLSSASMCIASSFRQTTG